MDNNFGSTPKLIGNHGYANQELVNLLLTGFATSNVFDGVKTFEDETEAQSGDKITMKGVGNRAEVGFLTLFEAYQSVEVGSNFKSPKFSVWIVCSESHYSCLFRPDQGEAEDDPDAPAIDVYYYDPLGEQEDEIKLTLNRDVDAADIPSNEDGDEHDLVPPIDKVVRTKWGKVAVDWNGAEPIL